MNAYISYFKKSKNEEYLKRVNDIRKYISQEYHILESNEIENDEDEDEEEDNKRYFRKRYDKSSFLEKLKKPINVICCLNCEYANSGKCLAEFKLAEKNWNYRILVCVEEENSQSFYGIKEISGYGRKPFTYSENCPKMLYDCLMAKDLCGAASTGDLNKVKYFVEKGTSVNNYSYDNPTQLAARNGYLEVVKYLCESGADLFGKSTSDREWTPLHYATRFEHFDIIKYLTEKMDNKIDIVKNFETPLQQAAGYGFIEIVKFYHEKGGLINEVNGYCKALDNATFHGHIRVVEYLCSNGASVNGLSKSFSAKYLLFLAIEKKHLEIFKYFCENGANVNIRGEHNITPLHFAITRNDFMSESLIEKGADVNAIDEYGNTPLHIAASNGSLKIIESLVKRGANINQKNANGHTAILKAMYRKYSGVFMYFYKLMLPNDLQKNLLMIEAVKSNSLEIVEFLLKAGVSVNYKDDKGWAPIHYAVNSSYSNETMYFLIKQGTDLFEITDDFKTTIEIAFDSGSKPNFKWLLLRHLKQNDYVAAKLLNYHRVEALLKTTKDDEYTKRNFLSFINEIIEWFATSTNKETLHEEITLKNIYLHHFDQKYICNDEPYNPHLMMCTVELNCGHSACLRCALRLFKDIHLDLGGRKLNYNDKVIRCSICLKTKYKEPNELLNMQLNTIWSIIDYSKTDLVKQNIEFLNERLSYIKTRKETTNKQYFESYLETINYQEESIDIKIHSLKMKINKIKNNLQNAYLKYFAKLRSQSNDKIYVLHKIESLCNFIYSKNIGKRINFSKIGSLKMKPSCFYLDNYWKRILNIENQIYLKILNPENKINEFHSMLWTPNNFEILSIRLSRYYEKWMNSSCQKSYKDTRDGLRNLANDIFTESEGFEMYNSISDSSSTNSESEDDNDDNEEVDNEEEEVDNEHEEHLSNNSDNMVVDKNENTDICVDETNENKLLCVLDKLTKSESSDQFLNCLDELNSNQTDQADLSSVFLSFKQLISEKDIFSNETKYFHFNFLKKFKDGSSKDTEMRKILQNCFRLCKISSLVNNGVEIHRYKDNKGATALHIASLFGRNDIILWLYFKKFKLDSIDCNGFTALAYAASNNQISTIALLNILGLNDMYRCYKPFLRYYLTECIDYTFSDIWNTVRLDEFMDLTALLASNWGMALNYMTKEEEKKAVELISYINGKNECF